MSIISFVNLTFYHMCSFRPAINTCTNVVGMPLHVTAKVTQMPCRMMERADIFSNIKQTLSFATHIIITGASAFIARYISSSRRDVLFADQALTVSIYEDAMCGKAFVKLNVL